MYQLQTQKISSEANMTCLNEDFVKHEQKECKSIMVENLDPLLTDVTHIKDIGNIRNRTAFTGVTGIPELPTLQT